MPSLLLAALILTASAATAQTPPPLKRTVSRSEQIPSVVSEKPLIVQDAWIRATPGADIAAAYMTLRNAGPTSLTVTGVESPAAGHAMIHETKVEAGVSKMRPHEQLVIAPGATVKLQPGGLHVMLHDLKKPLSVGDHVPLIIQLSTGGPVAATATVRPLTVE